MECLDNIGSMTRHVNASDEHVMPLDSVKPHGHCILKSLPPYVVVSLAVFSL